MDVSFFVAQGLDAQGHKERLGPLDPVQGSCPVDLAGIFDAGGSVHVRVSEERDLGEGHGAEKVSVCSKCSSVSVGNPMIISVLRSDQAPPRGEP